jgi:signal transduction histidine kinase
LVFYVACYSAGLRSHIFQREMLNLQFDNEQLIASLDQQTRQTQEAMASRSRLLAGAAHDLRQPVLALSLYADWLRGDPAMAPDVSPKIMESTAAINRLFDGLFGLAELDRELPMPHLQPIDIAQLLRGLLTQYEGQARSRLLNLRMYCPVDAWALSDPASLRRILGNFIDNAIKYTDQGAILVGCRRRGTQWRIEVWDSGIGVAEDQLEQVFTEFYRATELSGTQHSFGLGLAIVKRLANRIDAKVEVQSIKDRGSKFSVEIQRWEAQGD